MSTKQDTFTAIGEVMLEMAPLGDGLFRKGHAGDTYNTLWHMAHLLGPHWRARYVTRLGQDALSDALVQEMQADGLDTSGIARDPARTMGLYLIELDGVERSFHYWRGQSAARGLADNRETLARALAGAGLIHLSGITLAILPQGARDTLLDVLAEARGNGALVSFDPNYRPRLWENADAARAAARAMLPLTDIALTGAEDEAALWGDASPRATLDRLAAAGVPEVAVKSGAETVLFLRRDKQGQRDTPAVADIRDTTGAGDAFNAGYLAARLRGHGSDSAVGWGHRVAARVLGCHGARADKAGMQALADSLAQG